MAAGSEWFWFFDSRYQHVIRSSIYSFCVNKDVFKSYMASIAKKHENHQFMSQCSEQTTGKESQLSPTWTEKVLVYCIFVSLDRIGQYNHIKTSLFEIETQNSVKHNIALTFGNKSPPYYYKTLWIG